MNIKKQDSTKKTTAAAAKKRRPLLVITRQSLHGVAGPALLATAPGALEEVERKAQAMGYDVLVLPAGTSAHVALS